VSITGTKSSSSGTGQTAINGTQVSTSTTTGGLVVSGGCGISGNLNIGGGASFASLINTNGITKNTNAITKNSSLQQNGSVFFSNPSVSLPVSNTGSNAGLSILWNQYPGTTGDTTFLNEAQASGSGLSFSTSSSTTSPRSIL